MNGWVDGRTDDRVDARLDGWMDERRLTGPCACPSGIAGSGLGEERSWEVW